MSIGYPQLPRPDNSDRLLTGSSVSAIPRPLLQHEASWPNSWRQLSTNTWLTRHPLAAVEEDPVQVIDFGTLRDDTVLRLARTFSTANRESPFSAEKDGPLDPNGANFDSRAWSSAIYKMYLEDPEATPRTAGVAFKSLGVHGFGSGTDFQKTVGNLPLKLASSVQDLFGRKKNKVQILQDFEGLLHSGEMLCVLGPPGSGCSTLLKTIAGETHGLHVDPQSYINYQGISPKQMSTRFRGEAIYTAEVDAHFPMLTVGDTLYFASLARAPRTMPGGVGRHLYAQHLRDVVMAIFGISHTVNTRVGDK